MRSLALGKMPVTQTPLKDPTRGTPNDTVRFGVLGSKKWEPLTWTYYYNGETRRVLGVHLFWISSGVWVEGG